MVGTFQRRFSRGWNFLLLLALALPLPAAPPSAPLRFTDPAGDVKVDREKFTWIDVTAVAAERTGSQKIELTFDFADPLPLSTESELNVDLFLDLDRKPGTGDLFWGIGHDLFLCLYLNKGDRRWQASQLIKSDFARAHLIEVETVQVLKRRMRVVLRSKAWKDGAHFDLIVRPREKQTDLDQAPDQDKGAFKIDL
jgi:hypothetical protein